MLEILNQLRSGDESVYDISWKRSIGLRQLDYLQGLLRLEDQAEINRELVAANLAEYKRRIDQQENPTEEQ